MRSGWGDGLCTLTVRDAQCERQVALWWRSDRAETTAQHTVRRLIDAVPAPRQDNPGLAAAGAGPERIAG